MTTSGTTSFNPVRDQIVNRALRIIGAYASTDSPRPEQSRDAIETLNMMLKSWQIDGFLWLKGTYTQSLVANQNSYSLGVGSPDGITIRPTRIFSATRKNIASGYEIPMIQVSREDYLRLPNKTTVGTPVQFYYDPQLVLGVLYVWPAPLDATDQLILNADRTVQDMTSDQNTYDLPQEWSDAISVNLASKLASEYGLPIGERQLLAQEASALKMNVESYSRENTSTFFGVTTNGS